MTDERKRTIRKNVDFALAVIRTVAAVASGFANVYILYRIILHPAVQVIHK